MNIIVRGLLVQWKFWSLIQVWLLIIGVLNKTQHKKNSKTSLFRIFLSLCAVLTFDNDLAQYSSFSYQDS